MKLLFDQNLSFRLCQSLADVFPDSEQVRHVRLDHATDDEIWTFAKREGFTIVSLDGDFADMAALRGAPPKVVWLRCGNRPTASIERLLRDHAETIAIFATNDDVACLELY